MQYVALLRGIGPGNPNMHNDKLRGVFEGLGFHNVTSVISSGNVLFESGARSVSQLEKSIEDAMFKQLGFHSTTIIRSRQQIEKLVRANPFGSLLHTPASNLNVTFLKREGSSTIKTPFTPDGQAYSIIDISKDEICSVIDISAAKTPNLMSWLEREFSKDITTRTWKTVQRILAKWTVAD